MQIPSTEAEFIAAQLKKPAGAFSAQIATFMAKSNKAIYDLAMSKMDIRPGNRILEIGPADGSFVNTLFEKEPSTHYTGIDYSEEMIEAANKKNEELIRKGKASFVLGDVETQSFDQVFNIIFSVNTLYFWKKPLETLVQLRKMLTDDGELLHIFRSGETLKQLPFASYGFTLYSAKDVEELFKKAGYTEADVVTADEWIRPEGQEPLKLTNIAAIARP